MDKHAYLIMCHTNINQLYLLLELLDYEENDIYLHIDKKTVGYSKELINQHIKKANLFFMKPINVNWGGDSQIKAEIALLKEATKIKHSYYHLLSGMDLPLKTQDEIHKYFKETEGKNYLALDSFQDDENENFTHKIKYYYFFQNIIGRNKGFIPALFLLSQRVLLKFQKLIKINRIRNKNIYFVKGANWFSITHESAEYVINAYKDTKRIYKFSRCPDEIFLQTILYNSVYKETIVNNCLRCIDWNRGTPYTFKEEDYETLMNSKKLFARKFDMNLDSKIIDKIYEKLKQK